MAAPALSHCGQLLKSNDYDRFAVSLFAPSACREALWALYAFNLEVGRVRFVVREPLLGRIRLQWWRETIDGVYRGVATSDPVSLAIGACLSRHRLRQQSLQQIIDGCETDLLDPSPQRVDDLLLRLRAKSEPLVTGALDILGIEHAATRHSAQSIGLATALVEVIRAHLRRSDHGAPRRPSTLQHHGPIPPTAQHSGAALALPADITDLAIRVDDCLRQARSTEVMFDRQSRAVLLPATVAQDHIARLRKTRYRPWASADERRHPVMLLKLALCAAMRRY